VSSTGRTTDSIFHRYGQSESARTPAAACRACRRPRWSNRPAALPRFPISLRALLQGEREESLHALHRAGDELSDPEARSYIGRSFARLSAPEDAPASLSDVVHDGFFCYPAFVTDPWLDGIRDLQPFRELLLTAQSRHEAAREAFRAARGSELM
jgi:hypothetical protein